MEFLSLLKARHSIKSYKDEIVPKEKIKNIFESIKLSPSYRNLQSFKAILINDISVKEKLEKAVPDSNSAKKGFIEAPLSIVVTVQKDVDKEYNDNRYYMLDGAIVMYNILLSATSENLGSCWIEIENEEEFKSILNIPENYKVIGLTPIGYHERPIGYIKEDPYIIDKKSISDISYENTWENNISYF